MAEIFKDIAGYEGLYKVSNLGTVVTSKRQGTDERVLKGSIDRTGYRRVALLKDGTSKSFAVHRLVCMTFLPNPENKRTVNHKNGDKCDNRLANLEWMTHSENHRHAYKELGKKSHMCGKISALHPNAKAVKKTCILTGEITIYPTLKEANESGDFNMGHISACCNHKRKKHKGFLWAFV